MIIHSQLLKNFKALRGPHVIPLAELGVVHVTGENKVSRAADSNGSCKSSVVIAGPCWTLFGRTEEARWEVGGERVRNRFTDESVVGEMEYESAKGERFHLTRERAKGGADKVRLTGPHGKIYDAKHEIERELGFDWSFFTNVVVFGPDTSARFTQATDGERKTVFDQIVPDLQRMNVIFARADSMAKTVTRELEAAGVREQALLEKIESFEKVQRELDERRKGIGDRKFEDWRRIMGEQQALNEERINLYEQVAHRLLIDERFAALQPALFKRGEAEVAVDGAHEVLIVQEERVHGLEANLDARIREAEKLIKKGSCPTCLQRFSRRAAKELIERAKMRDAPAREQLHGERKALGKMREDLERLTKVCGELNYVVALNAELQREDRNVPMIGELTGMLTRATKRLAALEQDEVQARFETVPDGVVPVEQARGDLRKLEAAAASLKVRDGDLDFWTKGLGREIKSLLLDGVEGYLDARLRHYSGRLTAGEATIGFSSRTTLRSGEARSKMSLTAESVFGAGEIGLHSSGERQKIDVAVILAMQDLARRQRGCEVRLSLFDEVFDHLDSTGVERLMELMIDESKERGTICIITQSPHLASMPANHQVIVRRESDRTTVIFDGEEV